MKTLSILVFALPLICQTPPPPRGAAPTGGGNAYGRAGQLPARIMSFTAKPESIQPGQSVTLEWLAENPVNTELAPGIGVVRARGSRVLTPSATTTYVLTVTGPRNQVVTKELTVTVAGTQAISAAGSATVAKEAPKMPDGKPNLSGVYNAIFPGTFFPGGAPMNIAGQPGPKETKPALKAGAEKFKVVRGPEDSGLSSDCRPLGVPQSLYVPYQWQIIQGLDKLVIVYEYPGMTRIVPINGAAHQADLDPTWMGDSIGHWEGDTLVVDTVGFNNRTEVPGGFHHTEALHVVERFRRAKFETMEYEATIEDPNVFEKPWTIQRTFPLRTDLERVDEFVCENNRDYTPLFKK